MRIAVISKRLAVLSMGAALAVTSLSACSNQHTEEVVDTSVNAVETESQAETREGQLANDSNATNGADAANDEKNKQAAEEIIALLQKSGFNDCLFEGQVYSYTYSETSVDNPIEIAVTYDNIGRVAVMGWEDADNEFAKYLVGEAEYVYQNDTLLTEAELAQITVPEYDEFVQALIPDIETSCEWVLDDMGQYEFSIVEATDGFYTITKKGSNIDLRMDISDEGVPAGVEATIGDRAYIMRGFEVTDTALELPTEVVSYRDELYGDILNESTEAAEGDETESSESTTADTESKATESSESEATDTESEATEGSESTAAEDEGTTSESIAEEILEETTDMTVVDEPAE